MRIVVLGAGHVGRALLDALHEDHEITVIDVAADRLAALSDRFDVLAPTLGGHAGGAPLPDGPVSVETYADSVEAFQAGFGPHAKEIMADIPNYTDQSPVIQISEVVVG